MCAYTITSYSSVNTRIFNESLLLFLFLTNRLSLYILPMFRMHLALISNPYNRQSIAIARALSHSLTLLLSPSLSRTKTRILFNIFFFFNIGILSFHKNPLSMILANIHPYCIVLILILSYPRILCFYINRGGGRKKDFFYFLMQEGKYSRVDAIVQNMQKYKRVLGRGHRIV